MKEEKKGNTSLVQKFKFESFNVSTSAVEVRVVPTPCIKCQF